MNRSLRISGVMSVLIPATAAGQAGTPLPPVQQVVDYIDDLYTATSSHAEMTMTVVTNRGTRVLTLESWSLGDDEALIVIRDPPREAGTATLRTADGLWNYAPRADRLIRVPPGLLSDSWMGSHFTNDDLLRETSYLDDHEPSLAWAEHDGESLLEVTLIPDPEVPVVYTRLVFLVATDTWVPRRAEYYDEDSLIRTLIFDDAQMIVGKRIPMHMIIQPASEPNERTEIVYSTLDLDVDVDPTLFTRRGLRRVARD